MNEGFPIFDDNQHSPHWHRHQPKDDESTRMSAAQPTGHYSQARASTSLTSRLEAEAPYAKRDKAIKRPTSSRRRSFIKKCLVFALLAALFVAFGDRIPGTVGDFARELKSRIWPTISDILLTEMYFDNSLQLIVEPQLGDDGNSTRLIHSVPDKVEYSRPEALHRFDESRESALALTDQAPPFDDKGNLI